MTTADQSDRPLHLATILLPTAALVHLVAALFRLRLLFCAPALRTRRHEMRFPLSAFLLLAMELASFQGRCADVVLQPVQTFQTIDGWGHGGGILGGTGGATSMLDPATADTVNYQYLDYLLDDLGLTGTRTWDVGPRIDGTGNDHGDCDVVDWDLFEGDTMRPGDAAYLLYFQDRILAQGCQPNFYSSPGYPTHASDLLSFP